MAFVPDGDRSKLTLDIQAVENGYIVKASRPIVSPRYEPTTHVARDQEELNEIIENLVDDLVIG